MYVKDEDVPLWDLLLKVAKKSGEGSISSYVAMLMREHLLTTQEVGEVGRIVITTSDSEGNEIKKAFIGRWLFKDIEDDSDMEDEDVWSYGAAITKKGNIVLYGHNKADEGPEATKFEVYASVQEALLVDNIFPAWVIQGVAKHITKVNNDGYIFLNV